MRIFIFVVLILFSLLNLNYNGCCAENDSTNLLSNSGFEEGDAIPTGWRTFEVGDGVHTFKLDKENAHSGKYSVLLSDDSTEGNVALIQACSLKPETNYHFTGWIKVLKESSNGWVSLRLRGNAKGIKWTVAKDHRSTKSGEWQQFDWEFKTPDGLGPSVDLWLCCGKGNGNKIWFDDLELKELAK